jgi:preflagellin peptidase FlaK
MLDILKILFCTPFLLYACYSDLKKRRVTNDVWLIMLAGSIFFILYDTSKYGLSYLLTLLSQQYSSSYLRISLFD